MNAKPTTPRVREAMCEFLAVRYAEDIERARWSGNMLVTHGVPKLGVQPDRAERQARLGVHAAECKQALFEETVRPYLGTAGPTGRIADQQLRLLVWTYLGHEDYRDEWRP